MHMQQGCARAAPGGRPHENHGAAHEIEKNNPGAELKLSFYSPQPRARLTLKSPLYEIFR